MRAALCPAGAPGVPLTGSVRGRRRPPRRGRAAPSGRSLLRRGTSAEQGWRDLGEPARNPKHKNALSVRTLEKPSGRWVLPGSGRGSVPAYPLSREGRGVPGKALPEVLRGCEGAACAGVCVTEPSDGIDVCAAPFTVKLGSEEVDRQHPFFLSF